MRFLTLFLFAISAQATVITLGTSNEKLTETGTGTNAMGLGTVSITLGSCSFDGTNTTCTLTGNYTGIGNGGQYQFKLVYPGNGTSAIGGVQLAPGSDLLNFTFIAPGGITLRLTPSSGDPVTFYYVIFSTAFTAATQTCTGVSVCSVNNVSNTPMSTIAGPVTGQADLTPVVSTPGGVSTATSYGASPAISPGTWIEIYGHNLSTTLNRVWGGGDFNGSQAPNSLGGTTVTIAGKQAYVDYVNENQVNAQVPTGIATGNQRLVVTTAGGPSIGTSVTNNSLQPGILAPPVFKLAAGQYAVALLPNGAYVLPPGVTNAVPTARAKPGDIITLYGVGFGPVSPNIEAGIVVGQPNNLLGFQANVAGVPATIQFAGLVAGNVGLYQFNIVVPNVPANDATPFTFNVGGNAGTQTLLLAIGS